MKVGDMVRFRQDLKNVGEVSPTAIVVKRWFNHKGQLQQLDVLWASGRLATIRADVFEVISESR